MTPTFVTVSNTRCMVLFMKGGALPLNGLNRRVKTVHEFHQLLCPGQVSSL